VVGEMHPRQNSSISSKKKEKGLCKKMKENCLTFDAFGEWLEH
jgi:hypothetical protein